MILEVKNLTTGYRQGKTETILLQNASFQLHKGAIYSIFGANGIGKSTLIYTICGIIPPLNGELRIGNNPLSKISKKELSKLISIVLTERPHVEYLTVYDFVAFGRTPHTDFTGFLTQDDHAIIKESMEMSEIYHKQNQLVDSLSDGEFQKALIAKALAQQTPIIIMDEPASYLDYANQLHLMNLLKKLANESGKTILLTLHHLDLAVEFCNYMFIINLDKTLKMGIPEDLVLNGDFNSVYHNNELEFDSLSGSFKHPIQCHVEVQIDAPALQKKWIEHALMKNNFSKIPFIIRFKNDAYQICQEDLILAEVDSIDGLLKKIQEMLSR